VSEQLGGSQGRRSHIPSRRYRITEAGRERFHEVMMDTTSYLGEYQKMFLQKVAYFSFLQPAERLQLIEHYLAYARSLASYGTTQAEMLAGAEQDPRASTGMTPNQLADLLTAMQHKVQQWQQEVAWAEGLRKLIKAEALSRGPGVSAYDPDP
jgi:hypothetical protein